jgi:tRNA pseudouridine55 synthase
MLGVINLDKPVGPTSHDMVGLIRRLTGTRRIGHAGTLDPLASGVLPILVGPATRFSEELTGGRKRYDAIIRLGERSATDDAEGPITRVVAPLPDDAQIRQALSSFAGEFDQRPPDFSARKHEGRTAYRAARAGTALELPPRRVVIDTIKVVTIERRDAVVDVAIDLHCGPGTYVRSLARDVGDQLGCGGHLRALRRTEAAGLRVGDAVTPDLLQEAADAGTLAERILSVGELLPLPPLVLDQHAAWRFAHGSAQDAPAATDEGRVKVLESEGRLLGIGLVTGGQLRPDKVLPEGADS